MSLEPVLIDTLSGNLPKVVKFGCVNAAGLRSTYFATDYRKEDGTFQELVRDIRYVLYNELCTVTFIQESEDNFSTEIKKIKKYLTENQDEYSDNFFEYILASVDAAIPVVNRCRLFKYHDFISARDLDATFFARAKQEWGSLIDERKKQTTALLETDKKEFIEASNQEGADEVQEILNVLDREYQNALSGIKSADSYHDLIKIWPVILLPRLKAA
jgi:hypothetical protein